MGCRACEEQRQRVAANVGRGEYKQAAVQAGRGVGMMLGLVPKTPSAGTPASPAQKNTGVTGTGPLFPNRRK